MSVTFHPAGLRWRRLGGQMRLHRGAIFAAGVLSSVAVLAAIVLGAYFVGNAPHAPSSASAWEILHVPPHTPWPAPIRLEALPKRH